jgi:hypothetical protein
MRYLIIIFMLTFAGDLFAAPPSCDSVDSVARSNGDTPSVMSSFCSKNGRFLLSYTSAFFNCATPSRCTCPAGQTLNTITANCDSSSSSSAASSEPSQCPDGQVKNVVSGQCEEQAQCTYPDLYNSLDNSCKNNSNNCAVGTKPSLLGDDGCIPFQTPSCPTGWLLDEITGAHCIVDPNAPSSSAPNASSADAASSTPASSAPNNNSSAPSGSSSPNNNSSSGNNNSSGNDGDNGGGDNSGGNNGGGNNGGNNGGSNGSSGSAGSSSGNGTASGGENCGSPPQCDSIAREQDSVACAILMQQYYLRCPKTQLDDLWQSELVYNADIQQKLNDSKQQFTDKFETIRGEISSIFGESLSQSGSGVLQCNIVEIFGVQVDLSICNFSEFFELIQWVFLFLSAVLCAYILLGSK